MRRRSDGRLKRRTRQHFIADLGINHVERQVLLAGNTVERKVHDYGIDLVLSTFTENGEPEPGLMSIQVKSTDRLTTVENGEFATCRIERADLRVWLADPMPVFLVLFDAQSDRAYWLHVQADFGGTSRFQHMKGPKSLTVRLSTRQILDAVAVRNFRSLHEAALDRIRGVYDANE